MLVDLGLAKHMAYWMRGRELPIPEQVRATGKKACMFFSYGNKQKKMGG
jgi:hypothetical protein